MHPALRKGPLFSKKTPPISTFYKTPPFHFLPTGLPNCQYNYQWSLHFNSDVFYTQNLSRVLLVNPASTYSCSLLIVMPTCIKTVSLRQSKQALKEMFEMSSASSQQSSTKAQSHELSCCTQPNPPKTENFRPDPIQSMGKPNTWTTLR